MMTRKDYVATAKILAEYRNDIEPFAFADLVQEFSAMFESDNPNFSVERFESACYLEEVSA